MAIDMDVKVVIIISVYDRLKYYCPEKGEEDI